ncbi:MAG: tetratricopeptide repeat protein [Myxococcota bacterium]
MLLLVAIPFAIAPQARAQPVKARLLRALSIERRESDPGFTWNAVVDLALPARVVRSSPGEVGDVVRIRISFPAAPTIDPRALRTREALTPPPGDTSPVEEIVYDGRDPTGPTIEVRFRTRVRFAVRQGADFRSVVISMGPIAADQATGRVDAWMEAARQAMVDGDFERAVLLYTKVLSTPGEARKQEAQELLGVAYERDGRPSHAVAEYEIYLERYPDGEGAVRVRQRWRALVTATAEQPDSLREAKRAADETDVTVFGSISTTMTRSDRWPDGQGHDVAAFEQFGDLFLTGLVDTPGWRFRPELAARGQYDYQDSQLGDSRVSTLQLEAAQTQEGFSGTVGRQTRNRGGVLGRFDGAQLGYRFSPGLWIGAVGGFPLESSTSDSIDTDRMLVGGSFELSGWDDRVDLEVYGLYQEAEGFIDRAAVGAELRYADERGSAAAALDFDAYYESLNVALLVWQWQTSERLGLNGLVEYRNSPYLTTRNAVLGQDTSSLDSLDDSFSTSEIEDLARDRTRREVNLTLGGNFDWTPQWQIAGDFTASRLGGTPTSGGVEGSNAPGWEYLEYLQVSRSDWLTEGDVWTLGSRFFQGADFDSYSLVTTGRWPLIANRLDLLPRTRLTLRDPDSGSRTLGFEVATRLDWRIGDSRVGIWVLELEGGADRADDLEDNDDEWGVFVDLTLRVDF